ncbi:MAG: GNAT family N-acetyltransferase, partial [Sphingomonas sp.]
MTITIRPAVPADIPTILRFVRELAAYEREPDAVEATEAMF